MVSEKREGFSLSSECTIIEGQRGGEKMIGGTGEGVIWTPQEESIPGGGRNGGGQGA